MKQSSEEQPAKEENAVDSQPSHEALFGTILIVIMAIVVAGVLGGVVWGGYRGFQMKQKQTDLPSIGTLSVQEQTNEGVDTTEKSSEQESVTAQPTTQSVQDESVIARAKNSDIKVLNGGAAKGSASTVAELLKKDGFTKVTPGNTLLDYSGVTVYFSAALEKEAGIVRESLLKTYPKTEIKVASKENKETSQAPMTVILGK